MQYASDMDEEKLRFPCPHCRRPSVAPPGYRARCVRCGKWFRAPRRPGEKAEPVPSVDEELGQLVRDLLKAMGFGLQLVGGLLRAIPKAVGFGPKRSAAQKRQACVLYGVGVALLGAIVLLLHFTGPIGEKKPYSSYGMWTGPRWEETYPQEGIVGFRWARDLYLGVGAIMSAVGLFTAVAGFVIQWKDPDAPPE